MNQVQHLDRVVCQDQQGVAVLFGITVPVGSALCWAREACDLANEASSAVLSTLLTGLLSQAARKGPAHQPLADAGHSVAVRLDLHILVCHLTDLLELHWLTSHQTCRGIEILACGRKETLHEKQLGRVLQ